MNKLITDVTKTYGDDAIKAVKAFTKNYSPARHADSLTHVVDDISAHMTRNPVIGRTACLTRNGATVARITEEQFQNMAEAQLVKIGKGDTTRIIDEFTGTTYYLTPSGPTYHSASKNGSISQDLWNNLLRLFS